MGRDNIADIITSIRNANMDKNGRVRIASTNITKKIVKILLQEGFIEKVRKHQDQESQNFFLVLTLRHRRTRNRVYRTILKCIS